MTAPKSKKVKVKGTSQGKARDISRKQVTAKGARPAGCSAKSSRVVNAAKRSQRDLPPIHPGEILLREFLEPMGISQYRLAIDIGVPPRRINEIVHEKRGISVDTAMRLGRFFGTSTEMWINLQKHYELETAEIEHGEKISKNVKPYAASA